MKTCPQCGKKVPNKYWESHINTHSVRHIMDLIDLRKKEFKRKKDLELAKKNTNFKNIRFWSYSK